MNNELQVSEAEFVEKENDVASTKNLVPVSSTHIQSLRRMKIASFNHSNLTFRRVKGLKHLARKTKTRSDHSSRIPQTSVPKKMRRILDQDEMHRRHSRNPTVRKSNVTEDDVVV